MIGHIYIFLSAFLLSSCGITSTGKSEVDLDTAKADMTAALPTDLAADSNVNKEGTGNDMVTYFVVVADTSLDYSVLHQKMLDLNRALSIPIDTMGRFYNKSKDLITLPDNDENEIYAGDYFPRRFPSDNLSLEYLHFYRQDAGERTIALVTGIYETEERADSALSILQKTAKGIFKIRSAIYVACMH